MELRKLRGSDKYVPNTKYLMRLGGHTFYLSEARLKAISIKLKDFTDKL